MALLFFDSCGDYYTTGEMFNVFTDLGGFATAAIPQITLDGGARGTYGLRFLNANDTVGSKHVRLVLPVAPTSPLAIKGIRIRTSNFANLGGNLIGGQTAHSWMSLLNGSTWQIRLQPQTDGTLAVYRGGDHQYSGATLLGQTTRQLAIDTFYYIWLRVLFHNSTGTVKVMVKSPTDSRAQTWLSLTGVDTVNSGSTPYWDTVIYGPIHVDFGLHSFDYDDLAVLDGSGSVYNDIPLGEAVVSASYATQDGASSDFTPKTGSVHHTQVADGIDLSGTGNDGDVTYNASDVVGNKDLLIYQPSMISGKLVGVNRITVARSPAGGALELAGIYRDRDGNESVGDPVVLTPAYLYHRELFQLNPLTGRPWQIAEVATPNQHGYKQTA